MGRGLLLGIVWPAHGIGHSQYCHTAYTAEALAAKLCQEAWSYSTGRRPRGRTLAPALLRGHQRGVPHVHLDGEKRARHLVDVSLREDALEGHGLCMRLAVHEALLAVRPAAFLYLSESRRSIGF